MKKAIFILAAVMMLFSGVAAVSAYEAHLINVTAHVENAMEVDRTHIDFGTVFPEEWFTANFTVSVSDSFCNENQWRVTRIDYAIWAEWKPDGQGGYYPWLGDAIYVGIDAVDLRPVAVGGNLTAVGPPPPGPPGAKWVMDSSLPLNKEQATPNFLDVITIGLDVPVFEGYWNSLTDVDPKPSGLSAPTVVILESDTDRYFPDGIDLGVDIKIQVTRIWKP